MRCPANPAEATFYEKARRQGWEVMKQGWPDFICFKEGKIALVEVKPCRNHPLKRSQKRVMVALANCGVPCYRWDPEGGFQRINLKSLVAGKSRVDDFDRKLAVDNGWVDPRLP